VTTASGELAQFVRDRARDLGFGLVGITTPEATSHLPFLRRWIEDGFHGEMGYLARPDALDRRAGPRRSFPDTRSVVVVGHVYGGGGPQEVAPAHGIIARYARGRDYHKVLKRGLRDLLGDVRAEVERREGAPLEGRIFVDTGPVLERDLARRAGLGWFGRNTMLIHPRGGSYFLLGALLLDVALPADEPFEADRCGSCRACVDACPTGALLGRDEGGAPVMDARRCISYLTIESRGPIPRAFRTPMGNRVFGCDICQEVCPFNGRLGWVDGDPAYAARAPGERPFGVQAEGPLAEGRDVGHPGTRDPSLIDLLGTALAPDRWEAFSRGSPIRRAGRAGFARNVCVALGNWGSPAALPVLAEALADPDALIRQHAVWAVGRIGSPPAFALLHRVIAEEDHPLVVTELEAALATQGT
jgi:epoxyqueuosine reductase